MEKTRFIYEDATLTVKILGDIDHHNARAVREEADRIILGRKPRLILLDLSAVEFMDSSGLGLILGRYNIAEEIGAELKIIKPAPSVLRILELAGIERIMKIEEAVKNEAQ